MEKPRVTTSLGVRNPSIEGTVRWLSMAGTKMMRIFRENDVETDRNRREKLTSVQNLSMETTMEWNGRRTVVL